MSKISELDIDKKNYISQNFGKLIDILSYNSAKDEFLSNGISLEEFELIKNKQLYPNNVLIPSYQEVYNKWKEYYESKFYEFIEVPVIGLPDFLYEDDDDDGQMRVYIGKHGDTDVTDTWNIYKKSLR